VQFTGELWFTCFSKTFCRMKLWCISVFYTSRLMHTISVQNITTAIMVRLTLRKVWRWWGGLFSTTMFEDSREQVSFFDYIMMITMELHETIIYFVYTQTTLHGHFFSNLLTIVCKNWKMYLKIIHAKNQFVHSNSTQLVIILYILIFVSKIFSWNLQISICIYNILIISPLFWKYGLINKTKYYFIFILIFCNWLQMLSNNIHLKDKTGTKPFPRINFYLIIYCHMWMFLWPQKIIIFRSLKMLYNIFNLINDLNTSSV